MKRPLRSFPLLFLALAVLASTCQAAPPQKWTASYWAWSDRLALSEEPTPALDTLYVLSETVRAESRPLYVSTRGFIPRSLPLARIYWLVFRFESNRIPPKTEIPGLTKDIEELAMVARQRGLPVAGIQLDLDSPTGSLGEYAAFLRDFKKGLPSGFQLSITALPDWFRSGTSVADLIGEVDEFVPQFYDVEPGSGENAIAMPIDAAKWGPIFNRFEKRYRIGVSTFSRALALQRAGSDERKHWLNIYNDLSSVDIGTHPEFTLAVKHNAANELVLTYRATRDTSVNYNYFKQGEGVEFVLTTPETIRAAVKSVKQMGGYSAGVVFFRWPTDSDRNGLSPNEVLAAAGLAPATPERSVHIVATDGHCAAVACSDLYLADAPSASPKPLLYVIRSSSLIDYFVPEKPLATRLADPGRLELSLPAFAGRGHFYLGRVVTASASTFTLQLGTSR